MRDSNYFLKKAADMVVEVDGTFLWRGKTVRELLFDGFEDPLLDLLKTLNDTIKVPFNKFGRNVDMK